MAKKKRVKILISQKFTFICLITGVGLWSLVSLYRWLAKDASNSNIEFVLLLLGAVIVIIPSLPFFEREKIKKPTARKPKKKLISVEEQLNMLSKLGIRANHENFPEWICNVEWGRMKIESNPYELLLYSLGGERQVNENEWEPLSDDIYTFDMECVEDDDAYAITLKRLSILSKGVFNISGVASEVNHDARKAKVSFTYKGKDYSWDLLYNDDWYDGHIISRINRLLSDAGSTKFFCTRIPDQCMYVVFGAGEVITRLNRLVVTPFVLEIAEEA